MLCARPSSLGVTVRVKKARSDELCLKGNCSVGAEQELADQHETVIKAANIPQQIPHAVEGTLFHVRHMRQVEVELDVGSLSSFFWLVYPHGSVKCHISHILSRSERANDLFHEL